MKSIRIIANRIKGKILYYDIKLRHLYLTRLIDKKLKERQEREQRQ